MERLTAEQQRIRNELAKVLRQQQKLMRRRDALIMEGIEKKVPRRTLAEWSELSEQRIYQVRVAEMERRREEEDGE